MNDFIEYQEFYIIKENVEYKFLIIKYRNELIIKRKNYKFIFNQGNLSLMNKSFYSINDAYKFIINRFEENKVIIKSIIINKEIKLIIKYDIEKEIELTLLKSNSNSNNIFINEIKELKNEVIKLKEENKALKNEIIKLKKYFVNQNPKDITISSDIINESYAYANADNAFCTFKSINDILYLIYSNENKSIIYFDLIDKKKIAEIKNSHKEYITNFRHYLDEISKRDLVMSISLKDRNIKLWNANNFECLLNIPHAYKSGKLLSACFLEENNKIYIITSCNDQFLNSGQIIVFDLFGNIEKKITGTNERTYYVDNYFDNITSRNYIITCNKGHIKSYDYKTNILFFKYKDNDKDSNHVCAIIKNYKDITKIFDSCNDGNIRIWNFHSGSLINKFNVDEQALRSICLFNDYYLFVGCSNNTIKLLDLNSGLILNNLSGHNNHVITIKKINHPKYGDCIISQNFFKSTIKIWFNKIYYLDKDI